MHVQPAVGRWKFYYLDNINYAIFNVKKYSRLDNY